MLKKPKTQEEEMMLLTQFLTLSALSKVFSEQCYVLQNHSVYNTKRILNNAINSSDFLQKEIKNLCDKQSEPFKSALLELKKGIDDSIYEDYIIPLQTYINKAFI